MVKENQNYNLIDFKVLNLFDIYLFIKKFINFFMLKGKKVKMELILTEVFLELKKLNLNPIEVFNNIILKLRPYIGIKLTRFGRRKIIFPILLTKEKSYFYILTWLNQSIKSRSEKDFSIRIVNEFLDILNDRGLTINKFNKFNLLIIENKPYLWRKYTKKNKRKKK